MRFVIRRRLVPLSTLACLMASAPAMAQRISMASTSSPVAIHSAHSATIPPIVGIVGSTLMPANVGSGSCSSACFDAMVGVRANTKWQLQVTLSKSADHLSILWFETGTTARRLAPGEYIPVASGDQPTLQHSVALSFGVDDETGTAATLNASQVAGLLSYRVVPLP